VKRALAAILGKLYLGKQPREPENGRHHPNEPVSLNLLLASADEEDRNGLRRIFSATRWRVVEAGRWAEVLRLTDQDVFPVALCDRELPGMDWRDGVRQLRMGHRSPAIILLSTVADQYLWEELVSVGAFDALTRPFRESQTLAMIEFAHIHWKTGLTGRRTDVR
jgi:DNA-binding response OmpR family regulator